jgi:hypothetical protein
MKKSVLNQSRREEQQRLAQGVPMQFYRSRPTQRSSGTT